MVAAIVYFDRALSLLEELLPVVMRLFSATEVSARAEVTGMVHGK